MPEKRDEILNKLRKVLKKWNTIKYLRWIEVKDLAGGQYSVNKNIRFKTPMIRSNLCNYSDAYIVVKLTINLLANAANENNRAEKDVALKNNAPFRSCISKFNNTLRDSAEDLDIVMLVYKILEYSQNVSITSVILWNYSRDEIGDVDDNTSDGKSFIYKAKIVGNTPERPGNEGDENRPPLPTLNVEVTIPLE